MGTPHPITGGPRDGDPPPKRPCTWVAGPHLSPRRFCFLTSIPPNLGLAEHGTRTPLPSLPGPPCCMSCSVPQFPPWPSMLPYVSALRGMATWPRRTSRAGPACSCRKGQASSPGGPGWRRPKLRTPVLLLAGARLPEGSAHTTSPAHSPAPSRRPRPPGEGGRLLFLTGSPSRQAPPTTPQTPPLPPEEPRPLSPPRLTGPAPQEGPAHPERASLPSIGPALEPAPP